jgi:hypothetical protein
MYMKPLIVAVAVLLAFAWAQQPRPAIASKQEAGRFQIFGEPAYLLDTTTGKVWRQLDLEDAEGDESGLRGKPRVWVPMTRLDSAQDLVAFVIRHPAEKYKKPN